jgi:hypothetical protein
MRPELLGVPVDPGRADVIPAGDVVRKGLGQGEREGSEIELEDPERQDEARRREEEGHAPGEEQDAQATVERMDERPRGADDG